MLSSRSFLKKVDKGKSVVIKNNYVIDYPEFEIFYEQYKNDLDIQNINKKYNLSLLTLGNEPIKLDLNIKHNK